MKYLILIFIGVLVSCSTSPEIDLGPVSSLDSRIEVENDGQWLLLTETNGIQYNTIVTGDKVYSNTFSIKVKKYGINDSKLIITRYKTIEYVSGDLEIDRKRQATEDPNKVLYIK